MGARKGGGRMRRPTKVSVRVGLRLLVGLAQAYASDRFGDLAR